MLPSILQSVVWGLAVYVVSAFIAARHVKTRRRIVSSPAALPFHRELKTFLIAYLLGWLFRFIYLTLSPTALTETISGMAVVGAAGLIVFAAQRNILHLWLMLAALAGELAWSVMSASKTPIIAAGLAIALRWALKGWTRKKIVGSISMILIGLAAFPALQKIKISVEDSHVLSLADANYPAYLQPLMSLVRRFDLFSAVTDATFKGPQVWMTWAEFVEHAIFGFIPQVLLPSGKVGVGTLWSTEIRSASLGTANANVSLAEGFIAEGYVLNGAAGIALGASFIAATAVLVSRLIVNKRIFAVSLGLLLVSFPVLFERGILGTLETAGKSIQIAVLIWLLDSIIRWTDKAWSTPNSTTVTAHHGATGPVRTDIPVKFL